MELLDVLIKERDFKWKKIVAETAEYFTAINSLKSSGFCLTMGQRLKDELEERCLLFYKYKYNAEYINEFEEFFDKTNKELRAGLSSRFGIEVHTKDECAILKTKYSLMISCTSQQKKAKIVGFHATVD